MSKLLTFLFLIDFFRLSFSMKLTNGFLATEKGNCENSTQARNTKIACT